MRTLSTQGIERQGSSLRDRGVCRLAASGRARLKRTPMLKRIFVSALSLVGSVVWAADFKVGDKVEVEWRSVWYAAEVKAVEGPDRWKIGYDGYGANWDEVVGPDRIRARGAAAKSQTSSAVRQSPTVSTQPNSTATSATTTSANAAQASQEEFPWPERPAGAKAGIEGGFLRVQSWFFNGRASMENQGWFFTKDGRVAMTPKGGFDAQAFSKAATARKTDGVYWIEDGRLLVRWANKAKTEEHKFARKGDDLEIGGLFASRVPGFKKGWRADVRFEGGATSSGGGAFAATSNTLTLRRDGTFGRFALGSASVTTVDGTHGGSSSSASDGTYEFDGYTLTLKHADGREERFTVFGAFSRDAQGAPEYLWREGQMMQRLEAK